MGEFEAIGDAVTGGIVGRAVEPKAGEAADGHTHETNCLNCGAALAGPYCHECGQHAHVHRTLSRLLPRLPARRLHFEGKIWRTLPLLAWKPGELTRRYIDGQRARFVSPVALFLFCVFLMFAVMGLSRGDEAPDFKGGNAKVETLNAGALKARGVEPKQSQPRHQGASRLACCAGLENAKNNPELVFYKLKTNAYKFSWALIPISVPFVWLLFPFSRRFRLYDHIVFVTYSLCFMMLLLVDRDAGRPAGAGDRRPRLAGAAVPHVPPAARHLRRRAVGRHLARGALSIFAFIAISLFVSLLVAVGAFD